MTMRSRSHVRYHRRLQQHHPHPPPWGRDPPCGPWRSSNRNSAGRTPICRLYAPSPPVFRLGLRIIRGRKKKSFFPFHFLGVVDIDIYAYLWESKNFWDWLPFHSFTFFICIPSGSGSVSVRWGNNDHLHIAFFCLIVWLFVHIVLYCIIYLSIKGRDRFHVLLTGYLV